MTKGQKVIFDKIFDAVIKNGGDIKKAKEADFKGDLITEGVRIPWKKVKEFKQEDGTFDFSSAFPNKTAGLSALIEDTPAVPASEETLTSTSEESEPKTSIKKTSTDDQIFYRNPVFVVLALDDYGYTFIGVSETFNKAWELKYQAISDCGREDKEECRKLADTKGHCVVQSANCKALYAVIQKEELK